MINREEMVFVVDEHNQPMRPVKRYIAHKNRLWHRTSGIWVLNEEKQILCQKRSALKDVNPGKWEAFFGGHLAPNEEYLHNAASEMRQELGMTVDNNDLIPYKVFKSDKPNHKEFQQIFALYLEHVPGKFNVEKEEVEDLSWKTIDEVKSFLVVQKDSQWVLKPWDEQVLEWLNSAKNSR